MASSEPWDQKSYNPEPWEKPDKPAPWLRKKTASDADPWDRPDTSTARPARPESQAVNDLRGAEQNALSKKEPSYYTGNGRKNKDNKDTGRLNSKVKKKGKGKGALLTILLMLIGGGAFLGTSNSLLAPAMEALLTAATDTQYASATLRSSRIMSYFLKDTGATATTWTGAKKYTHMSSSFKNRLAKQGITIDGTGSNKTLVFSQELADGTIKTKTITADNFETDFLNDVEFRDAYTKAKRGRVATFFDNIADKIYKKLGISRNLFANYKQSNDLDADVGSYKDTMSPKFEGDSTELNNHTTQREEDTSKPIKNEDGEIIGYETVDTDHNSNASASTTSKTVDAAALADADSFIKKAAESVGQVNDVIGAVGGAVCTAMRIGNMISIAVAANEIYQSINYFMGQMENISKMKAGYGDASAVNSVLNFMTTPAQTSTTNLGSIRITNGVDSEPDVGTLNQNGAPVEANGMLMMLANNPPNTETTKVFSLERVTNSITSALTTNVAAAAACAGVDITTSILSIGVTILTGGLSKVFTGIVGRIVLGTFTAVAISSFFSFLIPTVAQSLFTNVFETATGIPAGELFAKGASAANTRMGRSGSGQSLSSDTAAYAYNQTNNTVLALDAEVDRLNKSPFDITNRNTFFGSIAYSLLPVMISSNTSTISSFISTTAKSLASLTGRVSAEGEGSSYMTTFGECPNLDAIGAVGDIYCNPITSTDVSTLDLSPDDDTYQEVLMSAGEDTTTENLKCEDNGDCTIQNNSNLAKYITYCDGRESPFGVVDQNILSALQPTSDLGAVGTILNSIPIVNDIASIVDSGADIINLSWANGEKCGNTDNNSSFWNNEGKYYQRYVEDMRLLENMGAFEETGSRNPVVAYEDQYEAEHPIDNTYIGYLSRISGLTPENTETMLAFVVYYDFVNDYDASTRIAMNGDTSDIKNGEEVVAEILQNKIFFENSDIIDSPIEENITTNNKYIAYADIRNRSYAIC